jgi:MFS family permease
MMVLSLVAQAALSLIYLFISDPIFFVALRFVEGMFAAAFLPSARSQITDSIPPEKRGEAFGIFGAFFYTEAFGSFIPKPLVLTSSWKSGSTESFLT